MAEGKPQADDTLALSKSKGSKKLEEWKSEIRAGVRYRNIFGKSKDWARYKNMYRGYWGKATVPVNIIYALARSIIPQVYFRNPRISVTGMKPGYSPHAWVVERLDNYFIRELGLKHELKSMVLDAYLCGRGPGILGYDSEWGFNPSFNSEEFADESLTSFSKKGEKIEYSGSVKPGMPWFMRCNPMDFIVPWGTGRFKDAPWFAFRKMRTLRDIKEDPKYKGVGSLKASFRTKLESSTDARPEGQVRLHEEGHSDWVELWEVHDQRSGRVFVISLEHDKFLRDEIDHLQIEGLPARVIGFNEDPDVFWWTPDARLIEVQQLEMNDIRTMAKKHRRVALLKVLYDKGMLGKNALSKLLDDDPKAAVEIDVGAQGDVRKAVALFQSHVPPDLAIAAKEVREDVREVIGFSRNQMGSFEESSGRRTAHEAEIVRAASMIRIHERRDIMADMLESTMRGINQIMFNNWTEERVVDIVGPDGAKYWIRFTGKELRGEFAYKINPEETIPEDQNTRKAQAEKFLDVAAKLPQGAINLQYLLKQYSRQFEWVDPNMLFPSEGKGRSPEKAMLFQDFQRMSGKGESSFPALGG